MTSKSLLLLSLAFANLALAAASPARADVSYAFANADSDATLAVGYSGSTRTLSTGGLQGWVSPTLYNTAGPGLNTVYAVGHANADKLNNFFAFSLRDLRPGVQSLTLELAPGIITDPLTYRLGGVSGFDFPLAPDVYSPDAGLYDKLGSGHLYDLAALDPGQSNGPALDFVLDAAAIGDLNAAIRAHKPFFFIGGTVDSAFLGGGAPEPAVWALFILGFGLAGTQLRRSATPGQQPCFPSKLR